MRRSRRVGAARGERIRVAREPRERRGHRLIDVGVTTTGAGNAAARTAMRADGDADGAIDTDESADSDDDDGSGACSGGARGGVHEHASASACAATSRIHSKSWRVAGIFLITLIRMAISPRSLSKLSEGLVCACARESRSLSARALAQGCARARGRVHACKRGGSSRSLARLHSVACSSLLCAYSRARHISAPRTRLVRSCAPAQVCSGSFRSARAWLRALLSRVLASARAHAAFACIGARLGAFARAHSLALGCFVHA